MSLKKDPTNADSEPHSLICFCYKKAEFLQKKKLKLHMYFLPIFGNFHGKYSIYSISLENHPVKDYMVEK